MPNLKCMRTTLLRVFQCDKCGHKWIPKKKDAFDGFVDKKFTEEYAKTHCPKICPKCKTKKWGNYFTKEKKYDETTYNLILKRHGKEFALHYREMEDKKFRKERINNDIDRMNKEIEGYAERMDNAKKYLESLKKELSDIKN